MPVMDGDAAAREIRLLEAVAPAGADRRRHRRRYARGRRALSGRRHGRPCGQADHPAELLRTLDALLETAARSAAPRPEGRFASPALLDPGPLDRLAAFDDGHATLLEITGLFRRDAPVTVRELIAGAQAGEPETVRLKAHSLTGTAGLVGAAEVARIAVRLEAGARAGGSPPRPSSSAWRRPSPARWRRWPTRWRRAPRPRCATR